MAFYHVGGCSCPIGCCDCGVIAPTQKSEDDLVCEMRKFLEPFHFTAVYRDFYDGRRNIVKSAKYATSSIYKNYWDGDFRYFVNEPCPLKVFEAGHLAHDKFSDREIYRPDLLKRAIWPLIVSGGFTDEDKKGIESYFIDLFSYEIIQTAWR